MKASELMIGDWVNADDRFEPCYILSLEHDKAWIQGKYQYPFYPYDKISPIPLTEEILKANGFEDANANNGLNFRWYVLYTDQEYGDIWGRTNHEVTVAWRECNSDIYVTRPYADNTQQKIGVADIRFVHELQQALRLCGLNDLADNFKVE